jgi:lactoylglutathione lyase
MSEQDQQRPKSTPFPHGVFLPNGLNTDPPLPANDPTVGYKLNHFMMRIRDPEKSMKFYIELMGMRTVFTYVSVLFSLPTFLLLVLAGLCSS